MIKCLNSNPEKWSIPSFIISLNKKDRYLERGTLLKNCSNHYFSILLYFVTPFQQIDDNIFSFSPKLFRTMPTEI